MGLKLKRLKDQVMVITGASSGIGLATARLAAKKGARVVLAARDEDALRRAVNEIRGRGGRATYVVADVANEGDLEKVADEAVREFGAIDTWVNNAGVSIYGRLQDTPLDDKRKLFETDFWGVVHGCKIAVDRLKQRGGALINIGSIVSDRAIPLQGIYSAAKHAVKGYTDSLRMELEEEGLPISVTLVKPASIDTPYPEHARNYMTKEPTLPPPVYDPEVVARAILRSAVRPIRDVIVGGGGALLSLTGLVAPRLSDVYMERTMFGGQKKDEPAHGGDSLERPSGGDREHGTYAGHVMQTSSYTMAALSDIGRALPLLAFGAAVAVGVSAMRRAS